MDKTIPEFKFQGQPLSEEQTKDLQGILSFLKMGKGVMEIPFDQDEDFKNEFIGKMVAKRLEAYQLPFTMSNLFLGMSVHTWVNNPGKIMMLLRLAYQEWKDTGKEYFTIEDWASSFFPMGTPTEEEQSQWWNSQKDPESPLGNMVDNPEYWK
jgi:hypothetical protein